MGRCVAVCLCVLALGAGAGVARAQERGSPPGQDEVHFANGVVLYGHVEQAGDGVVIVWIDGEEHEFDARDVRSVRYAPALAHDALRAPTGGDDGDVAWLVELAVRPEAAGAMPVRDTAVPRTQSVDAAVARMNALAPRLAVHHVESHEGERIGGWAMVVASAAIGVALEITAATMPLDPSASSDWYDYLRSHGYEAEARYAYRRYRRSVGATAIGVLGIVVGVAGVFYGLSMTSERDISTWGPAPRPDYTVQRAISPSF